LARTGRRPGTAGTRERILAAARHDFSKSGFDRTTIRAIAAEAKVDPALVLHYFESKDAIFREAVRFPVDPAEFIPALVAKGVDGLGDRLVRFFVDTWDSPAGSAMLGVIRSVVANDGAATLMREFVTREVLGRLAKAIEVDEPQLRASLAGAQLIGMAMLRYVVKVEPIASADADQIVAWLGPTIQRYFTDPNVAKTKPARRSGRRR
jgi:AcrR family transcriptional regulator